jgi:tetratricopeptide (TPR) repeat protein
MVKRDYLLRVIEQMGVAWAGVLRLAGLRQGGQYEAAGQSIDQLLRQFLGLNSGALETVSAAELIGLIRLGRAAAAGDGIVAEKLLLLGALLREQAELHEAQGESDAAAASGLKALQIYLTVVVEEGINDERAVAAVAPLLDKLDEYELPFEINDLLWRFHEQIGDFAKAEDALFNLLDDAPDLVPEGIDFYERLATLTDADLIAGNLPRDEVVAGLAELQARDA